MKSVSIFVLISLISYSFANPHDSCPFYEGCECEPVDPPAEHRFKNVQCYFTFPMNFPQFSGPSHHYEIENQLVLFNLDEFTGNLNSGPFRVFKSINLLLISMQNRLETVVWDKDALEGVTVSNLFLHGFPNLFPLPASLLYSTGANLQSVHVSQTSYPLFGYENLTAETFDRLPMLQYLGFFGVTPQIAADAFVNSPIRLIDFKYTWLERVPTEELSKLKNLVQLDLSGNPLTLDHTSFFNMSSLQYLILNNIQLHGVELNKVFASLDRQLSRLTLRDCNLMAMPTAMLANLQVLVYLDLTGNYLLEFPDPAAIPRNGLRTLLLERNPISHIPSGSLANFSSMEELRFSETLLTQFDLADLTNMSSLETFQIGSKESGFRVTIDDVEKIPKKLKVLRFINSNFALDGKLNTYMKHINQRLEIEIDRCQMRCDQGLAWLADYKKCSDRVQLVEANCVNGSMSLADYLESIAPSSCESSPTPTSVEPSTTTFNTTPKSGSSIATPIPSLFIFLATHLIRKCL